MLSQMGGVNQGESGELNGALEFVDFAELLFSQRALKQGIELVPDHAIDDEGAAGIGDFAEKKLGSAVSIDIDGIDQVEAGNDVEMLSVGYVGQRFVKLAVHIVANY